MLLVQLVFVILFHVTFADKKEYYDVNSSERVNALFENFLQKYDKNYDVVEKLKRLHTFNETLAEVNRLNDEYPHTIFGITTFTDLTAEEMEAYRGSQSNVKVRFCEEQGGPQTHDAPVKFDWRKQGVVTSVKDQKNCAASWSFSATALVETKYMMSHGLELDLSEQQLLDCDIKSVGCEGGSPSSAFMKLIEEGGQEQEADYPYQATADTDKCQFNSSKIAVKVNRCSWHTLSDEDNLRVLLFTEGPVTLIIDSSQNSLHTYTGGILTDCNHSMIDLSVQLVGYGSENGVDYWIMKNSWGTSWGEGGYLRIQRGVQCLGLLGEIASVSLI